MAWRAAALVCACVRVWVLRGGEIWNRSIGAVAQYRLRIVHLDLTWILSKDFDACPDKWV